MAELVICPKRSQTPAHWAVHRRTCRSAAATAAAVLSSATVMAVAIVNDATTAAVANYTPVPVVAAAAAAAAAAAPDQWRRRGQVEVNGGERHVATETIRRVATKATGVEYRATNDNKEQGCTQLWKWWKGWRGGTAGGGIHLWKRPRLAASE